MLDCCEMFWLQLRRLNGIGGLQYEIPTQEILCAFDQCKAQHKELGNMLVETVISTIHNCSINTFTQECNCVFVAGNDQKS